MNQLPDTFFTHLDFFIHEELFEHARRYLKKLPGFSKQEAPTKFFFGILDALEGNEKEASLGFADLQQHATFAIPAVACQIGVEKRRDFADRQALDRLKKRITDENHRVDSEIGFFTAWALYQNKEYSLAVDFLKPFLSKPDIASTRMFYLAARVEAAGNLQSDLVKTYLENAIRLSGPDVAAAQIELLQWHLAHRDMDNVQLLLPEILNKFRLVPVMVLQLKVQMILRNWDNVDSLCENVLSLDPNIILPTVFSALGRICMKRASAWKEFDGTALLVFDRLEKLEPKNVNLWMKYIRMFSRMCAGRSAILQRALALAQRAITTHPERSACPLEYANQLLLQSRYKEAMDTFDKAAASSIHCADALIGKVSCFIANGQLKDADTELIRLETRLQSLPDQRSFDSLSIPINVKIDCLRLKMNVSIENQCDPTKQKTLSVLIPDCIHLLQNLASYADKLTITPVTLDNLADINLDILAVVINDAIQFIPAEPQKVPYDSVILNHCSTILAAVQLIVPGQADLAAQLARVRFLKSDIGGASGLLEQLMDSDSFGTNSQILLLAAEVALYQKAHVRARTCLDRAVANDFKLKDSLRYYLLQSRYLVLSGDTEGAISNLTEILKRFREKSPSTAFDTVQDYCLLYIDLIKLLLGKKQIVKAETFLKQAKLLFSGSIMEASLIYMAEVAVLLATGASSVTVTSLLESIEPDMQDHYYLAQDYLGKIYLKNGKRKEYVELYEKLFLDMKGTPSASRMLGAAYMQIPDPKKAIEVIQKATREQPQNQLLESTMGALYIQCHMYKNALNYYEAVIKRGNLGLRLQFAELLIDLGRHERAEQLLKEISTEKNEAFADSLQASKSMKLLAGLYGKMQNEEERIHTLQNAKSSFERDLNRARRENPDVVAEITKNLVEVLFELAESAIDLRDFPAAIQFLEQGRAIARDDVLFTVLERLAEVMLLSGEANDSFRIVKELQKSDPARKSARILLAHIAFRRKDMDHALESLREYFHVYPTDWVALGKTIPLMVRMGQLRAAERIMNEMELGNYADLSPAKHFCSGLLHRYNGKYAQAMELLAKALTFPPLRFEAGRALIEMLCNWDREIVGSQHFSASSLTNFVELNGTCSGIIDGMTENVENSPSLREFLRILPLLSRGDVNRLVDPLKSAEAVQYEKVAPPVRGYILATLLLRLNLKDRAVEILKQYDKFPWNMEDVDFLEKMWLLRTDLLNLTNRSEEVNQLIFRATEFNRSGYLVNMFEGIHCANQNFPKAAESFRKAFDSSGNRDFVSGERCAWAMIKANRPMEAITVLDHFKAPGTSNNNLGREVSADMWAIVSGLRQQALNTLAFKSDDEKEDARGRTRKTSKVS